MQKPVIQTSPDPKQTGWPGGIPYIIGNEGCERFSYYGMRAILYLYVVHLYQQTGFVDKAANDHATVVVHLFTAGVYALPMIGALIADRLLGKYRTILWLSWVYCAGHAVLSFTEGTFWGLYAGLALIAVGSGGIKPCVSAHVGDQFGKGNWHLLERVYQLFYFIINFGSFFSTLLVPLLREWFGWSVAFAVPGVLMFVATIFFWLGRHRFVHVPPSPGGTLGLLDTASGTLLFLTVGSLFFTANQPPAVIAAVSAVCLAASLLLFAYRQRIDPDDGFLVVTLYSLRAALRGDNKKAKHAAGTPRFFAAARKRYGQAAVDGPASVFRIISVFFLVSVFWALFDQHISSWIRQASMMRRDVALPWGMAFELTPDQIPALNPLMVMLLIPAATFGLFPVMRKLGIEPTPLRRMTLGMFIASASFVVVAVLQGRIDAAGAGQIHVAWQIAPYLLITMAEVLVSITGLEFAYSQAPARMKSIVMGFWLLTVTAGNVLVSLMAAFAQLELASFFWAFAGLMALAAALFGVRAAFYIPREIPH